MLNQIIIVLIFVIIFFLVGFVVDAYDDNDNDFFGNNYFS